MSFGSDQSDKAGAGGLAPDERCEASVCGWGGGDGVGRGLGVDAHLVFLLKERGGDPCGKLGSCFHRISMRLNAWLPSVPYSVFTWQRDPP